MRCQQCQKEMEYLIPDYKKRAFLKLWNYFEHEYSEGEIAEKTFEDMLDAVERLKPSEEG